MSALIRENKRKSLSFLRERSDMFVVKGWCVSAGLCCKLCRERMRDLYSLSRTISPSGEEFLVETNTEIRVCLRCSNAHGDLEKMTGVTTADMPLQDFIEAAVAHSVMSK